MRFGQHWGTAVSMIVVLVLVQPLRGDEPKFYNLEDIPDTTIGGLSYLDGDKGWTTGKTDSIPKMNGGRYDCRNKDPLTAWSEHLAAIRTKLKSYEQWLDNEYTSEDKQVRDYRRAYDDDVAKKNTTQAAKDLKNWQQAEQSRENIRRAKVDTESRLKALEKQRAEKAAEVLRICGEGGCGGPPKPCPPGQTCAGVCR